MNQFKEIKRLKMECPVCEHERNVVYGETKESLKIRGEEIDVTSKIHYCPKGDHYFYAPEDEEAKFQTAYDEYRKRKNFLQPNEIKQLRERYGLSQRNFTRLLDWGEVTIHRYESGAIQDDVHNDLLMLIKDFDNFKKYFESKKDRIDPDLARKINNKIKEIEENQQIKLCVNKNAITNIDPLTYVTYSGDLQTLSSNYLTIGLGNDLMNGLRNVTLHNFMPAIDLFFQGTFSIISSESGGENIEVDHELPLAA